MHVLYPKIFVRFASAHFGRMKFAKLFGAEKRELRQKRGGRAERRKAENILNCCTANAAQKRTERERRAGWKSFDGIIEF